MNNKNVFPENSTFIHSKERARSGVEIAEVPKTPQYLWATLWGDMTSDQPHQPIISTIEENACEDTISRKLQKLEECRKLLRQNAVDYEEYQTNQTNKNEKKSVAKATVGAKYKLAKNSPHIFTPQNSSVSNSSMSKSPICSISMMSQASTVSLVNPSTSTPKYLERPRLQIHLTRTRTNEHQEDSKKWKLSICCAEFGLAVFCLLIIVFWIWMTWELF